MGFQNRDIEACLTNPHCNSLTAAMDWLCLNLHRPDIPAHLRLTEPPPAVPEPEPAPCEGTLTFVSNKDSRSQDSPPGSNASEATGQAPQAVGQTSELPEVKAEVCAVCGTLQRSRDPFSAWRPGEGGRPDWTRAWGPFGCLVWPISGALKEGEGGPRKT